MQILFSKGEEFGNTPGLDIFPGSVKKLKFSKNNKEKYSIPHVGWNKLIIKKKNEIFGNLKTLNLCILFTLTMLSQKKNQLFQLTLNMEQKIFVLLFLLKNFCMSISSRKSGKEGLKIYKNFKN